MFEEFCPVDAVRSCCKSRTYYTNAGAEMPTLRRVPIADAGYRAGNPGLHPWLDKSASCEWLRDCVHGTKLKLYYVETSPYEDAHKILLVSMRAMNTVMIRAIWRQHRRD